MLANALIDDVCALVAEGKTTTQACQEAGTTLARFYRLLRQSDPKTQQNYVDAQECCAEAMADALSNIQDEIPNALMARVVSENRRWLLARRFSARYGDKLTVDDKRTSDLTAILREAIERIPRPGADNARIIEHVAVTEDDVFG